MIDYKIGDWVETCNIMPGIVQKIDKEQDKVEIFYPHYKDKSPEYTGGSCCSIKHCGVHKIDESLAKMMLSIGEERLTRTWEFLKRDAKIKSIEYRIKWYEDFVKDSYESMPNKKRKSLESSIYCNYDDPERNLYGVELYNYRVNRLTDYIEKLKNDLVDAWKEHDKLFHQAIIDLYYGNITNTTQGIWLSYCKEPYVKLTDKLKLLTIETGEKFIVKRKCRGKYIIVKKMINETKMLVEALNGHVCNDTAKAFYERNKGKLCYYKHSMVGFVAGYVEHYVIIGFPDKQGCIKSFSNHIKYDSSYQSYRFSKLNNITISLEDE